MGFLICTQNHSFAVLLKDCSNKHGDLATTEVLDVALCEGPSGRSRSLKSHRMASPLPLLKA
jgi:hypothetical protein